MKKVLNIALLGSLFASCALADEDLLAKVTNGALSDNSKGVKVLSLDEMKEVKGGAFYHKVAGLDNDRFKFWLASDVMYITTDSTGAIKTNSGTDSVMKKMGFQGNGIAILGVKDALLNDYAFTFYDTKLQIPLRLIPSYNSYARAELNTFKANAR